MLDFGVLTLPLAAAVAVFFGSLFLGQDIVIDKIDVSYQLQWSGFTSTVATRQFVDGMRRLNEGAASEISDLEVDPSSIQEGLSRFEDYFEIVPVINGTRQLLGMIPYYVEGEIAEVGGEEVMTVRVFAEDETLPVLVTVTKGTTSDLAGLVHQSAQDVMERINPYVVVLFHRQTELAAGQFDFPKTQASADRFLASQPLDKHFLMYGLLGRMHMLKAERDKDLSPDQKEAEYDQAMKFLQAALLQHEDFLYPYINIGLIYAARGKNDLAEQYYAKAVEINPNYLVTRKVWGDLLVKEGRMREAAIQYVAAVEINRENAELRDKLAQTYVALGRPDVARTQWEEALKISPTTLAYADSIRRLDETGPVAAAGDGACKAGATPPC
jgi:tetratricopeptide (TPR) repeat protein